MRNRCFELGWLLVGFALACISAGAQSAEDKPPVFHSATRLVQLSVVVTDKKGVPITGLTQKDFSVSDESRPQEIAVFSGALPAVAETAPIGLPPNVFTNRIDLMGHNPGAVTVVLFDSLNTPFEDQARVRTQVMQFLRRLKPEDHVAIYALTQQLLLLHEFTQDSAALVAAVQAYNPRQQGVYDASHPEYFNVTALSDDPAWVAFQAAVNQTDARIADQYKLRSAEMTAHALEAIANHLAAIPGRKNLVWVSGSFPMTILIETMGSIDRQNESAEKDVAAAARALNRANMSIYPVDASGVAVNAAMDPSKAGQDPLNPNSSLRCMDCTTNGPAPSSGMFMRQNSRDTERSFADSTGGAAFYGSNDINDPMKRAFDDGRSAYTLGFYPDHHEWNGKFRKLKVHVNVSGAQLRYRGGYFAEAEKKPDSETQARNDLQEAAMSPLDARGLSLVASGKLSGPASERKVELQILVDPKQLQLQQQDQRETGTLDLYFVQRNSLGATVAAESQRVGLNLEQKQMASLLKEGIVLARHLTIHADAADLRVLVRDSSSQALGSVVIPTKALLAAAPASPASAPAAPAPVHVETPQPQTPQ